VPLPWNDASVEDRISGSGREALFQVEFTAWSLGLTVEIGGVDVAHGGTRIKDIAVLGDQAALFKPVASVPTA